MIISSANFYSFETPLLRFMQLEVINMKFEFMAVIVEVVYTRPFIVFAGAMPNQHLWLSRTVLNHWQKCGSWACVTCTWLQITMKLLVSVQGLVPFVKPKKRL